MTIAKRKAKKAATRKFLVYFKTQDEHERMKEAAKIDQHNPGNPNLSEFARTAIREKASQILEAR
jgi:hypothetical protein